MTANPQQSASSSTTSSVSGLISEPLLLPGCAAYFRVRAVAGSEGLDAGDHHVAFVELEEILVDEAISSDNTVEIDVKLPGAPADGNSEEALSMGYLRAIGAVTAAGRAVVPEASNQ